MIFMEDVRNSQCLTISVCARPRFFLFSASHSAQVHLGFDNWSSGIQCCNLLPSGLAKEENGSAILAALATGTQNYPELLCFRGAACCIHLYTVY